MTKNCEICGKPIRGRGVRVLIEGAELEVCHQCSSLGSEMRSFSSEVPKARAAPRLPRKHRARDIFSTLEEVVDDYADIVRTARERRGLTQDKLAEKINEKVSLIKKIERGEFVPEDRVIKKLEAELDVKLTAPPAKQEFEGSSFSEGITLGDVVRIRHK
ncbi:multiprotein bridging factor aMBF1 [Methermicoccus shengliensis]|uniref:TIGR00270 family protein n=1 Tax=Methermicoccus shengliensis TaxID=660064 RepID=A0A832RWD1_9EURY|nr:multiprotein bridging factor aMBF1 [Methermicoccus shengliensis]KUK04872.1 MAG: Transcriptional regulator, XRE family [Euryarchaeota archaeon 55_53]KUK30400.1 MAG: Transcriptional regulator, XRE family [Methanosarcinales archeaon 56_1174]MDI3487912.1 putative transcription factor [Methanosarcinales archaeon]MDN5295346.1 putative transcription factor [Methanosarcinales archaeon]HIH69566.1 TIGR00270 family protein [Methermicoccus shengliensis]